MPTVCKAIDSQLEQWRNKGLTIEEESEGFSFLVYNHPHMLEGYAGCFMENGCFRKGTRFSQIKEAYLYDRGLRHVLLGYLEIVETSLKSVYCHEFCLIHGEKDYLDASLYSDPYKHKEVLDKADKQRKQKKHEKEFSYLNGDGTPRDLPLASFMKLLSIKDISDLYASSPKGLKRKIALAFGLSMKKRDEALTKFMRGLTFLRNQCAHGGRLFGFNFPQKACLNPKEEGLLRRKDDGSPDNSRLFGHLLVLRRLIGRRDSARLRQRIVHLSRKHPSVELAHYGFPCDWERVL